MRKWIWISLTTAVVIIGVGGLSVRPIVESQILSRAEQRGIHLEVGQLSLGFPVVTLRGVRAKPMGMEGVTVDLHRMDVTVGLIGPTVRSVEIHGGTVQLKGTPQQLRQRLSQFRERHGGASKPDRSESETRGHGRREIVRDIEVSWTISDAEHVKGSGLQFEHIPGSPARFGADWVAVTTPQVTMDVAGGEASWSRDQGTPFFDRVGASEVRVELRAGAESLKTAASRTANAEPGKARPATRSGQGQAVPASGRSSPEEQDSGLAGALSVDRQRVAVLAGLFATLRRDVLPRLPREAVVERLWVGLQMAGEKISIGPSRLSARRTEDALGLSLSPGEEARGTPLELSGRIPFSSDDAMTFQMRGGPVSLASLGVQEGDVGLTGVAGTLMSVEGEVKLSPDTRYLTAEGAVSLENLSLQIDQLADAVVNVPRLTVRGKARAAVDGSEYSLEDAELSLNQARFDGEFHIARKQEDVLLEASLHAPLVSCQELADSAPRALLGPVADLKWSGTFSLAAGVEANSGELSKMKVKWDFDNDCRVTEVPLELDPEQFRGLFSREVLGAGGIPMRVEFGPHSANWTPLEDITPYMEAALLVTEDGRFFRHDGFDDRAIESAIRDNTRAGRFVRGASTISMQLAKNLYLSREKTLSRKLQEAALTMLLEQNFDKRELLELYLNVIEFAPGVYGIGPAAAHYFDSEPSELSIAQAFFLASILPAPSASYFEQDGKLTEARKDYVDYLLRISHERGRLSEEELERAQAQELRFGVPAEPQREEPEDRGVHAVPSEAGEPFHFPQDIEPGRALSDKPWKASPAPSEPPP